VHVCERENKPFKVRERDTERGTTPYTYTHRHTHAYSHIDTHTHTHTHTHTGLDTPLDLGAVHNQAFLLAMELGNRSAAAMHMHETWRCARLAWCLSVPIFVSWGFLLIENRPGDSGVLLRVR
jgi:hypothetical protein